MAASKTIQIVIFDWRSSNTTYIILNNTEFEYAYPALTNSGGNCEMWLKDILKMMQDEGTPVDLSGFRLFSGHGIIPLGFGSLLFRQNKTFKNSTLWEIVVCIFLNFLTLID